MRVKSYFKKDIITPILFPPVLYFGLKMILDPLNVFKYGANYELHAILYFTSFLAFPALYLYHKKERLTIICDKKAFFACLFAYLPFLPLFLLLFGPILGASGKGFELVKLLILMCLNVSAVDFYVWRIWQGNLGKLAGIFAWLVVHIPESIFLAPYGIFKVIIFMFLSAVVFCEVYEKYRCVGGLMAGHVSINIGIALIRGEWW